ncbi:MAG: hypothetical protein KDA61_08870 [Planctomycetales bacterium]|nr:hypothetical protein [Planctomycetales bacterium]
MSYRATFSQYFNVLPDDPDEALTQLCNDYYEQLAQRARWSFGSYPRRVADEYAIANQVLHSFHERAVAGQYASIKDWAEFTWILARLTDEQVIDEVRRLSALKRGGGRVRGHSVFAGVNQRQAADFDLFAAKSETPSVQAALHDEVAKALATLSDPVEREVFVLRRLNMSNQEIAEKLRLSIATIERKRRRIRSALQPPPSGRRAAS